MFKFSVLSTEKAAGENVLPLRELPCLCLMICVNIIKKAAKEVLAAICHDIGKVYELSSFPLNDYTDVGQLLGHIVMGSEMVGDIARTISGFPKTQLVELKHCILAHHGELEYGSPKKPALVEAMALNFADNTDAKMETMAELFKANANKSSDEWLGYNRLLETNIRKTSE